MKATKIVSIDKSKNEINWNVPQWVKSGDVIVCTTGRHTDDTFQGFCLPDSNYINGDFSSSWSKEQFKLLDKPHTIVIEN